MAKYSDIPVKKSICGHNVATNVRCIFGDKCCYVVRFCEECGIVAIIALIKHVDVVWFLP